MGIDLKFIMAATEFSQDEVIDIIKQCRCEFSTQLNCINDNLNNLPSVKRCFNLIGECAEHLLLDSLSTLSYDVRNKLDNYEKVDSNVLEIKQKVCEFMDETTQFA